MPGSLEAWHIWPLFQTTLYTKFGEQVQCSVGQVTTEIGGYR